MNLRKHVSLNVVVVLTLLALAGTYVIGADSGSMANHTGHKAMLPKPAPEKAALVSLDTIHAKQLPAIEAAVQKAIQQLEAGHTQAALAELRHAQSALIVTRQALGKHIKPKFANAVCPIMGSPINPEKVTANLVREYQGEKVAFCCAGCPAAWDQLGDAEKATKLKQAVAKTQHNSEHH
jgi:hypothetical protein